VTKALFALFWTNAVILILAFTLNEFMPDKKLADEVLGNKLKWLVLMFSVLALVFKPQGDVIVKVAKGSTAE